MNSMVISRLVIKDFLIWRKMIAIFFVVSVVCVLALAILHNRVPNEVFVNLGFTLLITPTGTLGVVLLMQTNVFEKAKSTQRFIMSLPVTTCDFTLAKLLVNIPTFSIIWIGTTSIGFYFAFGLGVLPLGTIPFATMVFLGVFLAYTCILCSSLLTQSLGLTILAIMFFEVVTSAYLWTVLMLDPIQRFVSGDAAVWNPIALSIVAGQIMIASLVLVGTILYQRRRLDSI